MTTCSVSSRILFPRILLTVKFGESNAKTMNAMNLMKIVRRTHLYAGLFLAPWVAMYGFSGLIFNHGNWFAPGGCNPAATPVEWTVDVTALPQWPEPDALARKVVAALNASAKGRTGAAEYRLSANGTPKLQGGVSLQGEDEAGGSVYLSFDRQE